MTVRLLTLNVLFKGDVRPRLRALAGLLGPYDVVCLQELMLRRNVRAVAGAFEHHGCHGRILVKGGLVLLSRRPIEPLTFTRFPFDGPARPEWLMRKGVQAATVHTPTGALTVVNTHLTANRDDDWSPGNRYSLVQRRELDRLAEIVAGAPGRLAVVGDLNLPLDSPLLQDFTASTGLRNARAGDPGPTYRPTPSWPSPPALDHVLTRGLAARARLVFKDAVTLPDGRSAPLSDHYGIDVELNPA